MTSCQSRSDISQVFTIVVAMPALADTMSMWPNVATASATTRVERGRVAHVDGTRQHPLAGLLHQPNGLVEVVGRRQRVEHRLDVVVDVDDDDVSAVLGERDGMRPPLSASCTGDEGDLAVKGSHCDSLS